MKVYYNFNKKLISTHANMMKNEESRSFCKDNNVVYLYPTMVKASARNALK